MPLHEREGREPEREGRARESGEVVVAEERRLAPSCRPLVEERNADELEQADGGGGDAERDQHRERRACLTLAAHEQRYGEREHRVLGVLRGGDEVVSERVRT